MLSGSLHSQFEHRNALFNKVGISVLLYVFVGSQSKYQVCFENENCGVIIKTEVLT